MGISGSACRREAIPCGELGDLFANRLPARFAFRVSYSYAHVGSIRTEIVRVLTAFDTVREVQTAAIPA
jgi:hypothetical protein